MTTNPSPGRQLSEGVHRLRNLRHNSQHLSTGCCFPKQLGEQRVTELPPDEECYML